LMAPISLASLLATASLLASPRLSGRAPPRWQGIRRVASCSRMGISDRTATEGQLYDGWGAEGMRVLNKTSAFQTVADEQEVSHYDAVLIVAARAKQNAYENAEDAGGYIGNSFGGNLGAGMRKKKPAKSEVVSAIEQLLDEYDETGELPELVTPGIPQDVLDQWAAEEAAEEAAAAANASAANAAARGSIDEGEAALLADLGLLPGDVSLQGLGRLAEDAEEEEDDDDDEGAEEDDDVGEDEAAVVEEEEEEDVLASLLGDDDFDDVVILDEDEEELEADSNDDDGLADDLADLFGSVSTSADGVVEASGMSPGDAG